MSIQRITIVGTGLIGGSLGLAIRAARPEVHVVGCDREEVLRKSLAIGAVERAEADLDRAVEGSHAVVLATPIAGIMDCLQRLAPVLPEDVLISDTGSTKVDIVRRAVSILGQGAAERFLPGHPLAGKEYSGIENADATLFRGAAWIFIRSAHPPAGRQQEFIELISAIGARPFFLAAEEHDELIAWTSHLPQLVATALASTIAERFPTLDPIQAVSGRGLRDMTRLAASSYAVWRDIIHTNETNIAAALHQLEQKLAGLRESLKSPELREEFAAANRLASSTHRVARSKD